MFWKKIFVHRPNFLKACLLNNSRDVNVAKFRNFTVINTQYGIIGRYHKHNDRFALCLRPTFSYCSVLHRKSYSKGLLQDDSKPAQVKESQLETELQKITKLFPQARVVLNEFSTKMPQKIFEIQYKQNTSAPKGARKKTIQNNDWTCTYAFVWPEKIKFEATAISKRQAAEKAALQALHFLYINRRIDNNKQPIYNQDKIEELKHTIQDSIKINISEKSIERINRIWEDYENGIENIYKAAIKKAEYNAMSTPFLKRDSTIDEEEEFSDETASDEDVADIMETKIPIHPVYGRNIAPPSEATLERRDRVLSRKFQTYDEEKTPLPIDKYAEEISSTIEKNRVVVIVGAAGCGKSTRVPCGVLRGERRGAVLVAQTRRVAARGLAQRVAAELGEQVGETIGYQVRLDAKPPRPPAGSVLYCTSGVLLRRLQTNPGLEGCTHVFIDEVHERDINTDVSLLLLKRALTVNPKLKIILMSATLDTEVFTRYFGSCPVIEVPGRTYPVKIEYLEDIQEKLNIKLPSTMENCQKIDGKPQINCSEIAEVIKALDRTQPEGAILVFLPGWTEIKQTKQLLDAVYAESTHLILPVHSRLSTTDQAKMFAKPMSGVRKIVLATNIAETSITIPDVVYVVDSGAHKENRLKEGTGTASLETVWVSLAGAKQRAGRAGRVQPGHCYRLYTKEKEAEFTPHTTPEILRIPLEQTVLDCKMYSPQDKAENFLSELPEPPTQKAIQFAVNDLIDLGALTPKEQLTRLGSILSTMTLHPRLGRVLLHAAFAGGLLAAANVVTHCSDNVELFKNAADRREEIREIKRELSATSDHAALHWLQEEFERTAEEMSWKGAEEWCQRRGLRTDRLNYVKSLSSLHLQQLLKTGVMETTIESEELNRFSDVEEITSAILLSGSNSLLKTKRRVRTKGKLRVAVELFTSTGDKAHIGSESVNYNITKRNQSNLLAYFGGYHSSERRALVVYKTSLIPPHTALLFCQGTINKEVVAYDDEVITTLSLPKHKLYINIPSRQAEIILKAREMIWNTFQYYIDRDLKTLDFDENTRISRFKTRLLKAIGRILVEGHREYVEGKSVHDSVDR